MDQDSGTFLQRSARPTGSRLRTLLTGLTHSAEQHEILTAHQRHLQVGEKTLLGLDFCRIFSKVHLKFLDVDCFKI